MKMSEAAILVKNLIEEFGESATCKDSIEIYSSGVMLYKLPANSKLETILETLNYYGSERFQYSATITTSLGQVREFSENALRPSIEETEYSEENEVKDTNGLSEEATKAYWKTISGIVIQNPTISVSNTYLIGLRDLLKQAQKVLEE